MIGGADALTPDEPHGDAQGSPVRPRQQRTGVV